MTEFPELGAMLVVSLLGIFALFVWLGLTIWRSLRPDPLIERDLELIEERLEEKAKLQPDHISKDPFI